MNPSQNDSGFDYGFNGNQNFSGGSGFSNGAEFSGGSDVVLDSGGGEKKKKWPVIVLMVCVILAIGVGIASMFLGRGGDDGDKSVDNTGLATVFNKYANYVYLGEEKESSFELEWNYGSASEIKFMLDEDEDLTARNEFFEKAKELNDNFMKVFNETYPEAVDDISSRIFTLQSLSKRIDEDFGEIYDYAVDGKALVREDDEIPSEQQLIKDYLEKLRGFNKELGRDNEEN